MKILETHLRILTISFQVFSVYQGFDSLLQVCTLDWEFQLDHKLIDKQLVTQSLACFHDPDNCRINLHKKATISMDT